MRQRESLQSPVQQVIYSTIPYLLLAVVVVITTLVKLLTIVELYTILFRSLSTHFIFCSLISVYINYLLTAYDIKDFHMNLRTVVTGTVDVFVLLDTCTR